MDPEKTEKNVQRLCSEIQLFDLCDLDSCGYKSGRFCTNEKLLAKFESIREEEDAKLVYSEDGDDEDGQDEYEDDIDEYDYEEDE